MLVLSGFDAILSKNGYFTFLIFLQAFWKRWGQHCPCCNTGKELLATLAPSVLFFAKRFHVHLDTNVTMALEIFKITYECFLLL